MTRPQPHGSHYNFKLTCHTREQNASGQKRHKKSEQTRGKKSSGQGRRELEITPFQGFDTISY